MSDDLKRKKSDYLLELALEEQLENDGEMQAYQSGNERPHEFSDEHNRKIKDILKRAEREQEEISQKTSSGCCLHHPYPVCQHSDCDACGSISSAFDTVFLGDTGKVNKA